jgi:mRNA-degrading endonuclease RelE of RelBE toxin-antitoxin system
MQETNITPQGEASWRRLPVDIQTRVLQALRTPLLVTQAKPLKDRPGVFMLRVDDLRIIFTDHDSVRTIITVWTRSESDALGSEQ